MNDTTAPAAPVAPVDRPHERHLIAPLWHTVVLIVILLTIAGYGAYVQRTAAAGPQLVAHRGSALKLYILLIACEWGLLRFVTARGMKRTGTRFRDLLGERWSSWRDVVRDVMIALAAWAIWTGAEALLAPMLGKDTAKSIDSMLPRGPLEISVWVLLSISAGFCEEAIFRGYLQKQFQAITGSAALAILIQAVIFGVSHGYQGLRNVIVISILGASFGALAWWRRSIKPGMILHAWTDIFSGILAKRV
jgi:membrane protease YdiL (CAAX protease family)